MAIVQIKNLTGDTLRIQELYDDFEPEETVTLGDRSLAQYDSMPGLQSLMRDGSVEIVSVTVTPEEAFWIHQAGDQTRADNVGTELGGVGLFKDLTSNTLHFKSLLAGSNITIVPGLDTLTLNVPPGEVNTASNLGTGEGVFAQKSAADIQLKSIKAGSANVTVTSTATEISVNVPDIGEHPTASNQGTGQTLFIQKSGVDLQFRTLKAGNNVTIVPSGTNLTELLISSTGGGGSSVVGSIFISDILARNGGATSAKVFVDPGNTILTSCTSSTAEITVNVRASYPLVVVNGVSASLPLVGSAYEGGVAITLVGSSITANLDILNGATATAAVTVLAPPVILTLDFSSTYPGSQTEFKAGDTVSVTGTTNVPSVGVQVLDFGVGAPGTFIFASNTTFTVSITVADRGTTLQALRARLQARDVSGAYGAPVDTASTRNTNNLYPAISFGTITYPVSQQALKAAESATVGVSISNADTVLFTSTGSQVTVTSPALIEATKTVTYNSGGYNITVPNLQATVYRTANGTQVSAQTVVFVADTEATILVGTPAARLRSGGNDGTAVQSHTITVTSDQQLISAPSLAAAAGGGGFSGAWGGGPTVWTRSLLVHDNDTKGTYTWGALAATNLAGKITNTLSGGTNYVLGGFVARSLTFTPAFSALATLSVAVVDYTKLTAGIFTASSNPALRNASQGNHSDIVDTYTVEALSTKPTSIYWNDVTRRSTNSSGTAQITLVQEIV